MADLWPRLSRVLVPTDNEITLVAGTYYYSLPADVMAVSRVEWVDLDDNERGLLETGTWEIAGDPLHGTGLLHVAPVYADQEGTLRLFGYGRYDTTTNLILDDYVPIVMAEARAELYRRLLGDRVRFREWLARQQTQNTSVNEMLQAVQEADQEAARLRAKFKVWQRPVPGRV